MTESSVERRMMDLERQLRRTRRLVAGLLMLAVGAPVVAWRSSEPEVLRVRGLVVVDEQGRERIHLGAPVPDPIEGKRINPGTGLVINDTAGVERFGLSLFPNGRVVMGFDAPRGTGDERNRERISIVADQQGGAYIRFLDRGTRAKAFMRLGDDDAVSLDFLDWQDGRIVTRRLGARGDTVVSQAR